jgi:hypothetical protein
LEVRVIGFITKGKCLNECSLSLITLPRHGGEGGSALGQITLGAVALNAPMFS